VKLGDELDVLFGQKHVSLRIDRIEEKAKKEDAATFYTILKEERVNND